MEKLIVAVDPGTFQTGYAIITEEPKMIAKGHVSNKDLVQTVMRELRMYELNQHIDQIRFCIEYVQSYGRAVGQSVLDTALWSGAFAAAFSGFRDLFETLSVSFIARRHVKLWHCKISAVKKAEVNRAVQDKYGEQGTKKNPNPFYNLENGRMNAHTWDSLALATYVFESGNELEQKTWTKHFIE